MSCLIFKLKHVTQAEANEVRLLLEENDIAIYETDSGVFGTSVAGFWLRDDSQQSAAKTLLAAYAEQRSQRVRDEYQRLRDSGEVETLWRRFKSQPLRLFIALLAVVLILLLSVVPFFFL